MPLIAPLFAFGDSVIDAFNPTTWAFEGSIDVNPGAGNAPGGLWSLAFGGGGKDGNPNTLFFTDGVDGETGGLFGRSPPSLNLPPGPWCWPNLADSRSSPREGGARARPSARAKAKGTALKSASARWR
jgi:hypothetical protein